MGATSTSMMSLRLKPLILWVISVLGAFGTDHAQNDELDTKHIMLVNLLHRRVHSGGLRGTANRRRLVLKL